MLLFAFIIIDTAVNSKVAQNVSGKRLEIYLVFMFRNSVYLNPSLVQLSHWYIFNPRFSFHYRALSMAEILFSPIPVRIKKGGSMLPLQLLI